MGFPQYLIAGNHATMASRSRSEEFAMKRLSVVTLLTLNLLACAGDMSAGPGSGYEEVQATTVQEAPRINTQAIAPESRDWVDRGRYMVQLLGCETCHTNGALDGDPDEEQRLAGSDIGIAYTSPLDNRYPGVVFAPNITPDSATGIGDWSIDELKLAIRQGIGRHGKQSGLVMPWPGYSKLSDDDATAIAHYLKSLEPISHKVPKSVAPGRRTNEAFVYFGFYRNKE